MGYDYQTQRKNIFTDEGQRMFLKIRDQAHDLLKEAGAFEMSKAIKGIIGDSWDRMACVDRMVELGEIREITPPSVAGQSRVFHGVNR